MVKNGIASLALLGSSPATTCLIHQSFQLLAILRRSATRAGRKPFYILRYWPLSVLLILDCASAPPFYTARLTGWGGRRGIPPRMLMMTPPNHPHGRVTTIAELRRAHFPHHILLSLTSERNSTTPGVLGLLRVDITTMSLRRPQNLHSGEKLRPSSVVPGHRSTRSRPVPHSASLVRHR